MADDASVYPGALDTFTARAATMNLAAKHGDDHDKLRDAAMNQQAELGTSPSGAFATVKARFEDIETDVADAISGAVRKTTNQTMEGRLDIDLASGSNALLMQGSGSTVTAVMTDSTGQLLFEIISNTNAARLKSDNDLTLEANNVEEARVVTGMFLVGKTASGVATTGVEVRGTGQLVSSVATDVTNVTVNKTGSAVVSAAIYAAWLLSGSTIGSVTRNAATSAVLYNVSSDERRKTDVGLDAADGLDTVEQITVRRFLIDDAETSSLGVFAQELNDVVPNAVTVGGDDPATEPWQVAYSSSDVISHLLLAVQQLSARVAELEAA